MKAGPPPSPAGRTGPGAARRFGLWPRRGPRPPRPEWTYRRVPGPVARGLLVACIAAVGFLLLHVGGWGMLDRLDRRVVLSTYLVGLPVAALIAFFAVAPLLRAIARARPLTLGRTAALGAAAYGGLVLVWMVLIPVGPPDFVLDRLLGDHAHGTPAAVWLTGAYRHVLTPGAFALYGGGAATLGWLAAFGPRAAIDLRALTRPAVP